MNEKIRYIRKLRFFIDIYDASVHKPSMIVYKGLSHEIDECSRQICNSLVRREIQERVDVPMMSSNFVQRAVRQAMVAKAKEINLD